MVSDCSRTTLNTGSSLLLSRAYHRQPEDVVGSAQVSNHGSGALLGPKGASQSKTHIFWGGSHLESQHLTVRRCVLEGALNHQEPKWQLKPMHIMIHSIQQNLGNECHAARNSYLVKSSKVRKHRALSCKVQFATLVCFCFLLFTCSVPGLLWQGWVSGRRSLNKLLSELGFSKRRSNTIWDDHKKACILGLFIALLCSRNLIVRMVFPMLGYIIMLLRS